MKVYGYKFTIPPFSNYVVMARFDGRKYPQYVRIFEPDDCRKVIKSLYGQATGSDDACRNAVWSLGRKQAYFADEREGLEEFYA